MHTLNHTHDANTRSWIASANVVACDFPIQNLPFAVARKPNTSQPFRGVVAIGDQAIDLAALSQSELLIGLAQDAAMACAKPALNDFFALGAAAWQALRHAVFALLKDDASLATQHAVQACLLARADLEFTVPTRIGDYTDFYTSIDHARNVGRIARPDLPALTPNFQWLPIAYHGRASSVVVSGTDFHRPMGQYLGPGATPQLATPVYAACARMDFELEIGVYVGTGNALGERVPLATAEQHIFGLCLLNDWSARDIQFWEMAPLGPFLGKNFCTSISPWIVTLEALAPYRLPFTRAEDEPQPLAYLDAPSNHAAGVLDIGLEVCIASQAMRDKGFQPTAISKTNFKHQYWTVAQMLTQHTMGGCNLQPGDLFGSGTISGPTAGEEGAMIERTKGGREPITLPSGEQRAFLADGDEVILRGVCVRAGAARIGFGECVGRVLAARY